MSREMQAATLKAAGRYIRKLLDAIEPRIKSLEERPLPIAVKGDKGDDGKSVTVDEVLPAVREQVGKYLDNLPVPEDGKSPTVEDVVRVLLPNVEMTLDRLQAQWALDFERRAQEVFQRAIERIPVPKDGLDGLGFDDLQMEHDGERAFTFRFARGDQVKEFKFTPPLVLDRGFWADGKTAEQGDGYTFGGSYWIAQKATDTKPEIGNPDWRLAVKKGRDGKSIK